jgi:hypothetical protein
VTFLRGTHGFIFPVISAVRASTHNEVVRTLAGQASIFVMHHMQMLESTGLVRYTQLPPAAMSSDQELAAAATVHADAGPAPSIPTTLLWLLAAGIAGIAGVTAVRKFRRRPAIDPRAEALHN